jgi:hypothetical protein
MTKLELVAEAISGCAWDRLSEVDRDIHRARARAAIEALRPLTPDMDAALRSHGMPAEGWDAALDSVIVGKDGV